jgi:hypothetical protein
MPFNFAHSTGWTLNRLKIEPVDLRRDPVLVPSDQRAFNQRLSTTFAEDIALASKLVAVAGFEPATSGV